MLTAFALPASAGAAGAPSPNGNGTHLSNERTMTRWAHPEERAPIRAQPTAHSKSIVSTHYRTEDGFPEVYIALRSRKDSKGATWYEIRIPMRPNGRTGWVRNSTLGPLYLNRTQLVVDRSTQHATLYKRGHKIWDAPVGIGKSSTPTPKGHFWIREKFKTGDPAGAYGPMAFGTSDYSVLSDWPGGGVIGIHGTNEPTLIPGRPSHGCIRVQNGDLRHLWHKLEIGTPLLIH
jgi:lipoprotein-anchoring transpeptidase ErfK/SrfK